MVLRTVHIAYRPNAASIWYRNPTGAGTSSQSVQHPFFSKSLEWLVKRLINRQLDSRTFVWTIICQIYVHRGNLMADDLLLFPSEGFSEGNKLCLPLFYIAANSLPILKWLMLKKCILHQVYKSFVHNSKFFLILFLLMKFRTLFLKICSTWLIHMNHQKINK